MSQYSYENLAEQQIEEKEVELFIGEVLGESMLEMWRVGIHSDETLLTLLRKAKQSAYDNAATDLVDSLRRS